MSPLSNQQIETLRACCVDDAAFEQVLSIVLEMAGPTLKLRDYLAHTANLVFIVDGKGRCMRASRGVADRFGAALANPGGRSVETLFPGETGLVVAQLVGQAISTGQLQEAVLQLPAQPIPAFFRVLVTPLADPDGRARRVALTCREVDVNNTPLGELEDWLRQRTATLWEANRRLKAQLGFLEMLQDEMNTLVLVLDSRTCVVYLNRACRMLTGYTMDDVLGESVFETVVLPEDAQYLRDVLERAWQGESFRDVLGRVKGLSGEPRLMLWSFSPVRDDNDTVAHVICTGTDITGFHEAQEALRQSEALLYAIFDNPLVGLVLADSDLRVVAANRLARQWGMQLYHKDLEPGTPLFEFVIPEYREWFQGICDTVLDGEAWVIELPMVMPTGENRWFEFAATPVVLRDSDRPGFRLSATDITQRRMSALLKDQQERSRLVSKFVRDAAYEVRAPLTILRANLYMLEHDSDARQTPDYAQAIQTQAHRLLALFEALATLVELEDETAFKMEAGDVNEVIHLARSGFQNRIHDKAIDLQCTLAPTLPFFHFDRAHLQKAVEQVLDNAIRFTVKGGKITIRSDFRDGRVVISIVDNGPGIPPQARAHVFEHFFRVEPASDTSGFGLGLPIALRIAEAHGGQLRLEDTEGPGAKFVFELPLKPVESHEVESPFDRREE